MKDFRNRVWTAIGVLFLMGTGLCIFSSGLDERAVAVDTSSDKGSDSLFQHRGRVTEVEGRAKRLPKFSEDWIAAVVGSEVISGDKVRTLKDSRAELTLKELNVIRLAPLTTIDIVKLYEETKEGRDETAIKLEKGDIWAHVSQVEEKTAFTLSTPVVGAAITGTRFRVSVAEDSSTVLKVYHGEVRVTNSPENTVLVPQELPQLKPRRIPGPKQIPGPRQVSFEEWYYIVKHMQEIRIGKDGRLVSCGSFSEDDPDEQTDWVRWNKERDARISR